MLERTFKKTVNTTRSRIQTTIHSVDITAVAYTV